MTVTEFLTQIAKRDNSRAKATLLAEIREFIAQIDAGKDIEELLSRSRRL
jgi:hypothetical protein